MTTITPSTHIPDVRTARTAAGPTTRRLLVAGAVGLPLWSAVSLAQAATRTGFDLTRHPLSALSTGSLGWLQVTNFLVAGVLTTVGAVGLRRTLPTVPWLARLMGVAGLATVAAGALVMDPPPGFNAPSDLVVTSMTWHSVGHMVAGSVMFAALIAACVLVGRRLTRLGHRGLGLGSHLAGAALLAGDAWAIAGGTAGSLTIAIGGIAAMLWMGGVSAALAHRA